MHYRKTDRGRDGKTKATLTTATGDTWTLHTERAKGSTYGRQFMIIFQDNIAALAADKDAPATMFKALLWCLSSLSHREWRTIRQQEAADTMGLSMATVSRGLQELLKRKIVERRGAGPRQEWRLTTEGSFVGTAGQYHAARRLEQAGDTNDLPARGTARRKPANQNIPDPEDMGMPDGHDVPALTIDDEIERLDLAYGPLAYNPQR